jgi:hypothetical protein
MMSVLADAVVMLRDGRAGLLDRHHETGVIVSRGPVVLVGWFVNIGAKAVVEMNFALFSTGTLCAARWLCSCLWSARIFIAPTTVDNPQKIQRGASTILACASASLPKTLRSHERRNIAALAFDNEFVGFEAFDCARGTRV